MNELALRGARVVLCSGEACGEMENEETQRKETGRELSESQSVGEAFGGSLNFCSNIFFSLRRLAARVSFDTLL